MWIAWLILILGLFATAARTNLSFKVWTGIVAGVLFLTALTGMLPFGAFLVLGIAFAAIAVVLNVDSLRRAYLSKPVLQRIRAVLPPISNTEREAIEAGTVWWDAELFRGNPDWQRLAAVPKPTLTEEEQAFIDGPVEELCNMLDDWQITHELNDLPPEVWQFVKDKRFFSLNIPKQYGGLDFSPLAQSTIVMKVCSRSGTAGVTVMVPNSLGPAELLLHYGTEEQKDHYLPRLARGEEVPCFGLTGPWAGSDAGAMPDYGVVCKQEFDGKETLGFRITWEKRYITLGPVATLLGLAFKAYDPDHLLGDEEELGITCALIPTDTPGVEIGNRHLPLNAAFQNGPNSGKDVFIPLEWIIGGEEWVGKGWRMLMESLAAGRGISLPASSVAAAKSASRLTGAYARIRQQFGIAIGKFEGVEEALARIGGLTYMMDAARLFTTAGLALGEKPSVVSAILKYQLTDGARIVINDAMDIHGGKGICMGPNNYLARTYQQIPIAITVEGANILTRSLIVFGQGAMRCHPYLLDEIAAAAIDDEERAVEEFDAVFFKHLGYVTTNAIRSLIYGLSFAWLAPAPAGNNNAKYYRQISRFSAGLSFMSDITLLMLGGALKRKEKLSGRFADALSNLFLASSTLKYFEDCGSPQADQPLLDWSVQHALYETQQALDGIMRNFPSPTVGFALRLFVFPFGRYQQTPNDVLGHRVAQLLLEPSQTRDRLTQDIFISNDANDVAGSVEDALDKVIAAAPVFRRLRNENEKQSELLEFDGWIRELTEQGTINAEEAEILREARAATLRVISVDDFDPSHVSAAGQVDSSGAQSVDAQAA